MATALLDYDSGTSTLTIRSGTSSNPVRFSDVWDYNDGTGSSNGTGIVDGTTLNTIMTEHVADAIYTIDCNISFGEGYTSTHITSLNEAIEFSASYKFTVDDQAVFQCGQTTNGIGTFGSSVILDMSTNVEVIENSKTFASFYFYGSKFYGTGANQLQALGGTIHIYDSEVIGTYIEEANNFYFRSISVPTLSIQRSRFVSSLSGIFTQASLETQLSDYVDNVIIDCLYGVAGDFTPLLVPSFDYYNVTIPFGAFKGTQQVYTATNVAKVTQSMVQITHVNTVVAQQYTVDLKLIDAVGVGIENATIYCYTVSGDLDWSAITDANGDITQQSSNYKDWVGTSEVETSYTPHKIIIDRPNFTTDLTLENITIDEKINTVIKWEDTFNGTPVAVFYAMQDNTNPSV